MGLPGPSERVRADSAIQAAEFEAWKLDNRKKLGAHMGGERHLAVYAPVTGVASFALWMFEPPPTVANLHPEISDIWIFAIASTRMNTWFGDRVPQFPGRN
jgi:hypothetical protein